MNTPPNSIPESKPPLAIIALGANIDSPVGSPATTVAQAAVELASLGEVRVSSLLRSAPVDCPPGSPEFVNAVALVSLRQVLSPLALLDQLQALETRFGRRRLATQPANAPRPLDLDLISYGALQLQSDRLILPHPRAHQRDFVLAPLAELAPDLVLPGFAVSVQVLLAELRRAAATEY